MPVCFKLYPPCGNNCQLLKNPQVRPPLFIPLFTNLYITEGPCQPVLRPESPVIHRIVFPFCPDKHAHRFPYHCTQTYRRTSPGSNFRPNWTLAGSFYGEESRTPVFVTFARKLHRDRTHNRDIRAPKRVQKTAQFIDFCSGFPKIGWLSTKSQKHFWLFVESQSLALALNFRASDDSV